jgi:pimeloyl-ACP methyl ester carboxylesterase
MRCVTQLSWRASQITGALRSAAMSPEPATVAANGVEIAYETFGAANDPPMLLVMGLGSQMLAWPDELCADLAARGYFVIRFDNRDVGLSTHLPELGSPTPATAFLNRRRPPYRVEDMAEDAAGLLDGLGLASAHVVGVSMGGFIAQELVLRTSGRVRSLALIMTSTGSRRVGRPAPRVVAHMTRRRPALDRATAVEAVVETFRLIGSPGFPPDEARLRDVAGRAYDRCYDPDGYLRQLAAVLAQRDRTEALGSVGVPTVVIHGLADPLVAVSGGRALARSIPAARFVSIPGMGHDLPRALWLRFADEIGEVASRGDARPRVPD